MKFYRNHLCNKRLYTSLCFLILIQALLVRCYDGWDYHPETTGEGGQDDNDPTPETDPVFDYVLISSIALDANALQDANCHDQTGLATYRSNEYSLRSQAMAEAFGSISNEVVSVSVPITAADCQALAAITVHSFDPDPWGSGPDPRNQTLSLPVLHIRLITWNGDVAALPGSTVTSRNWQAMGELASSGVDVRSYNHFVISFPEDGYYNAWRSASAGHSHDGTGIETIDVTQEGIASRNAIIAGDTQDFVEFVLSSN